MTASEANKKNIKLEMDKFVQKTDSPYLKTFFKYYTYLLYAHKFDTQDDMRTCLLTMYKRSLKKVGKDQPQHWDMEKKRWRELFMLNKVSASKYTAMLFQWLYLKLSSSNNDFSNYESQISTLINEYKLLNLQNPRYQLELLSTSLLSQEKLSPLESVVVKLSCSYIINLQDIEMVNIYKRVIANDDDLWTNWSSAVTRKYIPLEEENAIARIANEIAEIAAFGQKHCRLYVRVKMVTLEMMNMENSLENQLYQIYEYILFNMDYWNSHIIDSEDEIVTRVKGIYKIILQDTGVEVKSGECTSFCSKDTIVFNEEQFGNGINSTYISSNWTTSTSTSSSSTKTKNTMGRRLDLAFTGYNGIELSNGEFKPYFDLLISQKQEGKNLRINQMMNFKRDYHESCDDEQLGLNWNGMAGNTFGIKYSGGVGIANKVDDMQLPYNMNLLKNFKSTLLGFYNHKHYLVQANKSLMDALLSDSPSPSSSSYTSSPPHSPTPSSSVLSRSSNNASAMSIGQYETIAEPRMAVTPSTQAQIEAIVFMKATAATVTTNNSDGVCDFLTTTMSSSTTTTKRSGMGSLTPEIIQTRVVTQIWYNVL